MAKTKISEFSATPGNNTDIDGINLAEGCAPSGINDAIRELMAQLKDFQAGTAGDSFNGPVGTTTAAAGAFTTLSSTGNTTLGDASGDSVTINGNANFANVNPTLTAGTANGVAYLNGSKVLTTGSALTFDGTNLLVGGTTGTAGGKLTVTTANGGYAAIEPTSSVTSQIATGLRLHGNINETDRYVGIFCYNGAANNVNSMTFWTTSGSVPAERMRLDNLGNLGIGTSSPQVQLHLQSSAPVIRLTDTSASTDAEIFCNSAAGSMYLRADHTNVAANSVIGFQIDGSDKMTLDSSGNLGLGVTPSASAGAKAINIGSIGYVFGDGSIYKYNAGITSNAYVNGNGTFAAIQSRGAGVFEIDDGVFKWRQASSGTAGSTLSLTQAMTLDASGNLGIGTTSPGAKLTISNGTINGQFNVDGSGVYVGTLNNYPLIFSINSTERARIDSSGNLLVGTTSGTTYRAQFVCGDQYAILAYNTNTAKAVGDIWNAATTGDNKFFNFLTEVGGTQRGSITYNRAGGLTVYNTTSDYRAKDIFGPVADSGEVIDSTPVYMGKMKGATQVRPMFIAHETPDYAHTGEKDAVDADGNPVYQQMDASSLVPVLWAEVQSLRKRLAAAGIA